MFASPANSRPMFFSPALYATPAATSLPLPYPDSASSFPPSPYIVNYKRRGPCLLKPPPPPPLPPPLPPPPPPPQLEEAKEISSVEENSNSGNGIAVNDEVDDDFDLEELRKLGTEMGEFYDAYDEIPSDGSSISSSVRKIEDEIREMRLNLLMEIEKRKQAEDAVENLQIKWQNLGHHLSTVGLVLPDPPKPNEEEAIVGPAEDLSQQIIVARVVASSVARGCARAVTEMELEPQIEAKNFEIARLLDRLRYYEAINREMSQRNQEAVEIARQRRRHRNRRQKWFWGSIGLVVTIGSAAIAWSYLPSSEPPVSNDY